MYGRTAVRPYHEFAEFAVFAKSTEPPSGGFARKRETFSIAPDVSGGRKNRPAAEFSTLLEKVITGGGLSDPESWPELQDRMIGAMIRFEKALRPHLDEVFKSVV